MCLSRFLCRSSHLLALRHLLQAISISMVKYLPPFYLLLNFSFTVEVVYFVDLFILFLDFTGKAGVNFFTQIKTVTQQWKDLPGGTGVNLAMPTSQKT